MNEMESVEPEALISLPLFAMFISNREGFTGVFLYSNNNAFRQGGYCFTKIL